MVGREAFWHCTLNLGCMSAKATDSRSYAVLNDFDHTVPAGVIDALRNYDVTPVLWTEREEVKGELAA